MIKNLIIKILHSFFSSREEQKNAFDKQFEISQRLLKQFRRSNLMQEQQNQNLAKIEYQLGKQAELLGPLQLLVVKGDIAVEEGAFVKILDNCFQALALMNAAEHSSGKLLDETIELLKASGGIDTLATVGHPYDAINSLVVDGIPHEEFEKGLVTNIVSQGYQREGKLIRKAKVIVSSGPLRSEIGHGERAQENDSDCEIRELLHE